ncbi:hypothetical protein ABEF91_004163 [Exophiala dermatitidis]
MLASPPKRRKIGSPEPDIDATGHAAKPKPTTPTRASYLSPTKSSLARSHPHLLNQAKPQGTSTSRGKSLREEILHKDPSAAAQHETNANVRPQVDHSKDGLDTTITAENEVNHGDITRNKTTGTVNTKQSLVQASSPFKNRNSTHPDRPNRGKLNDETLPPLTTPALVRRGESRQVPAHAPSHEPELPPTPVQLGLSPAPDKPRGLTSSSSPRRSLTGSGKSRRRTRGSLVTSSPLKPKARPPAVARNEGSSDEHDEVAEAQESEIDLRHEGDISIEVKERQSSLRSLREKLQQLRTGNDLLETLIEHGGDLSTGDVSILEESYLDGIPQEDDLRFPKDMTITHLTLFAPGNLQLHSRTELRQEDGRPKAVHYLTVTAPPPWLPDVFSFSFEVVVDTENVAVEHLQLLGRSEKRGPSSTMTSISQWLSARLENPLHRRDVGGLIWAIGKYFGVMVERAKVFRRLDTFYKSLDTENPDNIQQDEAEELSQDDTVDLSRWMHKSQLQLPVAARSVGTGRPPCKPSIMLVWDIELDWTGSITSFPSISVGGVSTKAEARLKDVFSSLLPLKGVTSAVDGVWKLAHGDYENQELLRKTAGKTPAA